MSQLHDFKAFNETSVSLVISLYGLPDCIKVVDNVLTKFAEVANKVALK